METTEGRDSSTIIVSVTPCCVLRRLLEYSRLWTV